MQLRDRVFLLVVAVACVVGFYRLEPLQSGIVSPVEPEPESAVIDPVLPDFSAYSDVREKKDAFFTFMLPLVEQENRLVVAQRKQLLDLSGRLQKLNKEQEQWLLNLARRYRVVATHNAEKVVGAKWLVDELIVRVDKVPPSLALAQAANESAWGTSRFAVEGNNLFGQWCFKKGCGLVPGSREEDARHEVARFSSPRQSVQRYIYNLNTNLAYEDFREWRARKRQKREPLVGEPAAETLVRYSARGEEYVDELQEMIRVNDLQQYDTL